MNTNFSDFNDNAAKQRIIQELVPGKQITLAHIIAAPDAILYRKLGLDPSVDYARSAIGIVTMTPTVMNSMIHMDMSEVIRIIISNGMILYALTRKTEGSK